MIRTLILMLLFACGYAVETPVLGTGSIPINGGGAGVFSSVTDSGLTATRVTFAGAGGLLSDDAGMTYVAATDTMTLGALTLATTPLAVSSGGTASTTAATARTALGVAQFDWPGMLEARTIIDLAHRPDQRNLHGELQDQRHLDHRRIGHRRHLDPADHRALGRERRRGDRYRHARHHRACRPVRRPRLQPRVYAMIRVLLLLLFAGLASAQSCFIKDPATANSLGAAATVLNTTSNTFTRATSAYDPNADAIVGSGVRRQRNQVIGTTTYAMDLLEGGRTCLFARGTSERFDQWTAVAGGTVTADTTAAPDGETIAQTLTDPGASLSGASTPTPALSSMGPTRTSPS